MAALESTSVQAVLKTPSELDAPDAEEGAVSPLSIEYSRWDAESLPGCTRSMKRFSGLKDWKRELTF